MNYNSFDQLSCRFLIFILDLAIQHNNQVSQLMAQSVESQENKKDLAAHEEVLPNAVEAGQEYR